MPLVNLHPAYVAGIVDGEGSIGFARVGASRHYVARVVVVNTALELLEDLKSQYGGDIRHLSKRKENWKQGYMWRVSSLSAVKLLEDIEPYLRLKYNQMLLVWGLLAIRPGKGVKWSADGLEAVDLLVDQSHWLNQRGPQTRSEPMLEALH